VSIAINAFLPAFWCVPSAMFTGTAAAAAIALINSIGNLGGYLGPTLLGKAKDATGSYSAGLWILGGLALAAAAMMMILRERQRAEPWKLADSPELIHER
jgi:ACS family tartrate transporter-like MFS transporter